MGCAILLVEDDKGIQEIVKLALEMEGCTVYTADNGSEGLKILATLENPCLIILDLMMPIMDGWTFAETLEKKGPLPPIVVTSAFYDPQKPVHGCRAVLKKPYLLDDLLQVAKKFCDSTKF